MKPPRITIEDEDLYAQAVTELSSGAVRQGLLAKCLVEADGDRERARIAYLKARVALLKEEQLLASEREAARLHAEEQAKHERAKQRMQTLLQRLFEVHPDARTFPRPNAERWAERLAADEPKVIAELQAFQRGNQRLTVVVVCGLGAIVLGVVIAAVIVSFAR